jgi:Recombination endonuclease VII
MAAAGPRAAAKAQGLSRYFTGVPCKRGHVAERNMSNASCVVCSLDEAKQRRRSQPDVVHAADKKWRDANKDKCRAAERKYQGLPIPTRPMPDGCEICGKPEQDGNHLAVDHDHDTDEFRGWLCRSCNTSIGKLGDNLKGLFKAVDYLIAAHAANKEQHVPQQTSNFSATPRPARI